MLDKTSSDPSQGVTTDIPAVGVTVQAEGMVLQTFLGRDEPVRAFHELTDKLISVIERQSAKNELIVTEKTLATDQLTLQLGEAQYLAIGERATIEWKKKKKQGDVELSASERIAKDNVAQSIKAGRASIERLKVRIAELKAKIEKVD